jgi:hypothetical protein
MDNVGTITAGLSEALVEKLTAAKVLLREFVSEIVATTALKDYWGHDPHGSHPTCPPPTFQPRYIALLYLRLRPGWALDVNHACYELPAGTTSPETRLGKALDILEDKVAQDVTFGSQNLSGHPPYRHLIPDIWEEPARLLDSGSLKDFKFKSSNEIFVFLHHENIDVNVYDKRLLAFKTHGAADGKIKHPNDTFYNARPVPKNQLRTLENKGTLIRVENYATGVASTMPEPLIYSMDIKFQIKAGGGWVTMVVDPDTGNGSGNEP